MASFTGNSIKDVYKDILHTSNSNTGLSTTIKQITCGDGDGTSLYLSQRNLKVQPSTDTTTNTVIYDADGNALVTVDSTNDLVKAGIGQHTVNTQFKTFGLTDFSPAAGAHHPLTVTTGGAEGTFTGDTNAGDWGGTGANPATTLTVASATEQFVPVVWFVRANITIDEVHYAASCDDGSTINLHVNSYTIGTGSSTTAGDLSSGATLALSGSGTGSLSPITVDDDRLSNGTLTLLSQNVDSGKVIIAFIENVGGTDDVSVQLNLKYHLR